MEGSIPSLLQNPFYMATKVKFLKDHLRHKKGEVALILEEAAAYFIRCNVAVVVKDMKAIEPEKATKGDKKAPGRKKK